MTHRTNDTFCWFLASLTGCCPLTTLVEHPHDPQSQRWKTLHHMMLLLHVCLRSLFWFVMVWTQPSLDLSHLGTTHHEKSAKSCCIPMQRAPLSQWWRDCDDDLQQCVSLFTRTWAVVVTTLIVPWTVLQLVNPHHLRHTVQKCHHPWPTLNLGHLMPRSGQCRKQLVQSI